jgi:hypothetical protein
MTTDIVSHKVPMQVRLILRETEVREDDGPFTWTLEMTPTKTGKWESWDSGKAPNWTEAVYEATQALETMWDE